MTINWPKKNGEEQIRLGTVTSYKWLNSSYSYKNKCISHRTVWELNLTNIAFCSKPIVLSLMEIQDKPLPPHSSPHENCSCGFYSLKPEAIDTWRPLGAIKGDGNWHLRGNEFALAKLELSGKIIEGKLGYRSEKAKMTEIFGFIEGDDNQTKMWYEDEHVYDFVKDVGLWHSGKKVKYETATV